MRLLGLDPGEKRIGLAVSDPTGVLARSLGYIERTSRDETVSRVREAAARYGVGGIVVGLPLNMNGSEGESARRARLLGADLRKTLSVPVMMWDERLTTAEAGRAMKEAGLTRKQRVKRIDALSAQIILQSYLDGRASGKR